MLWFVLFSVCWLGLVRGQLKTEIVIGGLFPLESDGIQMQQAVRLAQQAIVARTTTNQLPLERVREEVLFVFEAASTDSTQKETLEQSLNLIREKGAQIVIGPQASQTAEIASLVAGLNDVPVISYGATAALLSNKEDHPYFFRTVPSDDSQGAVLASTLRLLGIKKCVIIHTDGPYGFGLLTSFKANAEDEKQADVDGEDKRIQIVRQVTIPQGQLPNANDSPVQQQMEPLVNDFAENPDLGTIVMLVPTQNDALSVLQAAINLKLAGDEATAPYIWLTSNGGAGLTREDSEELSDTKAMVGLIGTTPARANTAELYEEVMLSLWENLVSQNRLFSQFNESRPLPPARSESVAAAYAFDAMLCAAFAVERALENGARVDEITGPVLRDALNTINFAGATGTVSFDLQQDRPALYDIINVVRDPAALSGEDLWRRFAVRDSFSEEVRRDVLTPIVYADESENQPEFTLPPVPPPEAEPLAAGFIVLIVIAVMLVVALVAFMLVRFFKKRQAERAAERERLLNEPPLRWTAQQAMSELDEDKELASGIVDSRESDDVAVQFGPQRDDEIPLFGLDKLARMPIMQEMTDTITLFNRSAQPLKYSIHLPDGGTAYEIDARPGVGTVKARQEKQIKLKLKLLHTYKLNDHLKVTIDGFMGSYIVPLRFEGELSLRLDPDELELLGKPIGGGAFGTVYRGRYRGTTVAAKVLRRQNQADEAGESAFRQEIALAERLRNPYIVNFIGASHVPGKLCMCTELLERGSVLELIVKVRVPEGLKIKLMLDAARAIAFLHENGVLYRDLKPDNLLVFSTSLNSVVNCKLSDFGTARIVDDVRVDGVYTTAIGTPIYMAPEMMDGHAYSSKVDVYAFAMLMWELMAEKQPFHNVKRVWDLPRIVVEGVRPAVDEAWPRAIQELISVCWMQSPDNRPTMESVSTQLGDMFEEIAEENAKKKGRNGPKSSKSPKSSTGSKGSKSSGSIEQRKSSKKGKKAKIVAPAGSDEDN